MEPNPLLTVQEMALWTDNELGDIAADPFAAEVNGKVGAFLCFKAGHPEWTRATTPTDVQTIAIWMFKRTYSNPDQETSSNTGPIGSRVLDDAALGMALTEAEAATLDGYRRAAQGGGTGFWRSSLAGVAPAAEKSTVYVSDDQQATVNLTNAAPSWDIPMYDVNDVGGPL